MSKYPFADLQVGQSAVIPFTASPAAARNALHNFRRQCVALGWPAGNLPNYRLTIAPGQLTVERLPDGHRLPPGPRMATPALDEKWHALRRIDILEAEFAERQQAAADRREPDWCDMKIPRELQNLYLRWLPEYAWPEHRVEEADHATR